MMWSDGVNGIERVAGASGWEVMRLRKRRRWLIDGGKDGSAGMRREDVRASGWEEA